MQSGRLPRSGQILPQPSTQYLGGSSDERCSQQVHLLTSTRRFLPSVFNQTNSEEIILRFLASAASPNFPPGCAIDHRGTPAGGLNSGIYPLGTCRFGVGFASRAAICRYRCLCVIRRRPPAQVAVAEDEQPYVRWFDQESIFDANCLPPGRVYPPSFLRCHRAPQVACRFQEPGASG